MKPLFWRILLLLLSSFAITIAAGFFLFVWLRQELEPDEDYIHKHSLAIAEKLIQAAENGQLEEAKRELKHRLKMNAWVISKDGRALGRRPVRKEFLELIDEYPAMIRPWSNPVNRNFVYGHRIRSKQSG